MTRAVQTGDYSSYSKEGKKPPRTCTECGAALTGQQRAVCSAACRDRRSARQKKEKLAAIKRICLVCGDIYSPRWSPRSVVCGRRCWGAWGRLSQRERDLRIAEGRPPRTCSAAPGGRPCPNPVTRDVPICHEHMPRFSTWRDPPTRPRITAVTAWARPGSQDDAAQPLEDA